MFLIKLSTKKSGVQLVVELNIIIMKGNHFLPFALTAPGGQRVALSPSVAATIGLAASGLAPPSCRHEDASFVAVSKGQDPWRTLNAK